MKVQIIPPKPTFPYKMKNVAAYCRVSTEQEMQHHSLEAQREYYKKFIESKILWRFAGVYADEASGRHNEKMKDFQRLMDDCRAGKIDLIVVKSISRFGRNTLQFLQACVELRARDIEVLFEVENLYLSDEKARMTLAIYAALYQSESQSKSHAIKWSFKTFFENGTSGFYNTPCYGYKRDGRDSLKIIPEEAGVVVLMYEMHQSGCSLRQISKHLSELKIKAPRGGDTWSIETIRKILNNEKYHGDVILQKTYVADYFSGRQAVNNGEFPKYEIKNHHPAIIERDE
ncbi:MAG: recombinase family protein [Ruminococcaceae bacterium]|nr:recombinase family protein [Oscillospiraceae bacterium]